jgi:lysyl-tRNA synthetase class 2
VVKLYFTLLLREISYAMSQHLSEQELQRREALKSLRAMGIEPYPAAEYKASHFSKDIRASFENSPEAKEWEEVSISGRMMTQRINGKASFADLMDSHGRVQVYFNRDILCPGEDKELYNTVFKRLLDIGDFIGITGRVFITGMGEITVEAHRLTLLSKSLRPLPIVKKDKEGNIYDAFSNPEQRYRMRYVDLVVNEKVKNTFITRTRIMNAMREFFNRKDYLEVETPILQPIPGGAAARPFITHHNALDIPLYLRVANELYLKRLIVGGFEGVYEFSKDFRNEGMDRTHNPEFTVMEIYVAYKDYFWMMNFTEEMLEHVVTTVNKGSTEVMLGEKTLNFKAPFARVTMVDAIIKYTGYDITGMDEAALHDVCKALHIETNDSMGKGKLIDEIFGEKCEGNYIQPTFIIDYPIEMSPLCKKHRDNPDFTERFELMINGKEVANAYTELNDPIDQRERFEEQLNLSAKGDDEAMFIDQDFLRALEFGMPPTSGMGIGIDRLTMMLTNNTSIQEVLFFPQMKPENKEQKKVLELNDGEKAIFKILKEENRLALDDLKTRAGLSNKAWDKSIKGLAKMGLTKVSKTEEGLFVELTED